MINFWIAKANEIKPTIIFGTFDNYYPIHDETYKRLITIADSLPGGKSLDENLIDLMLANRAFERNDVN